MPSGYPTPSHLVVTKRLPDSPYQIQGGDGLVLADAASGAVILNMVSASGLWGKTIVVKKIDSTRNAVTMNALSGQTIDGFSSVVIVDRNLSQSLTSDGFNWWIE